MVKAKGKWIRSEPNRSEEGSKKGITCHYCGTVGHMKKHCRKRLADLKSQQGGPKQKAHVAEHIEERDTESKDSTFFVFMAKRLTDGPKSTAWYIDSGASRHFMNMRDWFTKFTSCSSSSDNHFSWWGGVPGSR